MSIRRYDTDEDIQTSLPIPEGAVVLRAVEVVQYLSPDGQEVAAARWQGAGNVIAELGMIEYAKQELIMARFHLVEEVDDEPTGE